MQHDYFFWSSGTSTYLLFWKYCIVHFEAGGEWHFDYYPKQIMGSTTKQQHEQLLNCRELLQKSLTATNVFNFIIIQMLHTALVPILISVWHYCCVAVHTRIEHRVANPSWGLCWGQPQRACFVVLVFFWQINLIWSTAYTVQKLCGLSNVVQGLKSMGDFPWISSGVGSIQQWIKNRTKPHSSQAFALQTEFASRAGPEVTEAPAVLHDGQSTWAAGYSSSFWSRFTCVVKGCKLWAQLSLCSRLPRCCLNLSCPLSCRRSAAPPSTEQSQGRWMLRKQNAAPCRKAKRLCVERARKHYIAFV